MHMQCASKVHVSMKYGLVTRTKVGRCVGDAHCKLCRLGSLMSVFKRSMNGVGGLSVKLAH